MKILKTLKKSKKYWRDWRSRGILKTSEDSSNRTDKIIQQIKVFIFKPWRPLAGSQLNLKMNGFMWSMMDLCNPLIWLVNLMRSGFLKIILRSGCGLNLVDSLLNKQYQNWPFSDAIRLGHFKKSNHNLKFSVLP